MNRRHTALPWPVTATALALAIMTGAPSRSRAQLPEIPGFPAPAPGVDPRDVGGSAAPLPPVGALPAPDPVEGDPRTAPKGGASAPRPIRPIGAPAPTGPRRDPAVRPAADPGPGPAPDDQNPLAPARLKPGAPAVAGAPKAEGPVDGYGLSADRIPAGRQNVGLSVEVIAPEVMNVGQTKTIRIVVRNSGVADAHATRVYYNLPKELEFVSATGKYEQFADDPSRYQFNLNTLAAGSEQVLAVKVRPKAIGTIDHISTVSLMVGARSHSVIQEPKLRVEQTVSPASVLKGQQAQFRITVTNTGNGPARNVTVRAKLSSGLRANGDEVVEQTIAVLQGGQHQELDPLTVDTIAGGEQTCTVTAESEDVPVVTAEAKVVRSVVVLKPELGLALDGPQTRYTDTPADYRVTVTNPGSAAAKNVRVTVLLPASGGVLQKAPAGAEWNKATQKLTWVIPNLDPARGGEPGKASSTFRVRLNGVGLYRVVAEARAGELSAKENIGTSVSGMADIDLDVDEKKRVLDVGETTIFDITMKNVGTKEAKSLQVSADLKNVEVDAIAGIDQEAKFDDKTGKLMFPLIDSLAPGRTLNLSIRVKATKPGAASCRVHVFHEDIGEADGGLEAVANARVTPKR